MKFYYMSGACSMSCHIALEETGLAYAGLRVDFEKPDANLSDLQRLNPLGAVPVLVTDNGKTLTQNAAILEYLADLKPASQLMPQAGTWERAEANSWLSWVSSDLHKAFSPFFYKNSITKSEDALKDIHAWALKALNVQLAYVDSHLAGKDFLTGKTFTAADAYLFTVVGWCKWLEISTDAHKNLNAFMARVYPRPAVQNVLKQEGLLN